MNLFYAIVGEDVPDSLDKRLAGAAGTSGTAE
jgi:hypothetical protein